MVLVPVRLTCLRAAQAARMSSNQNVFSAPVELKAITINGAVHVESDEDRKKREERRKARKSRLV